MRKKSLALILAQLLCGTQVLLAQQQNPPAPSPPPPAAPQDQQEMQKGPTIRVPVNLVDVLFTVLNRRNKLVSDLEQKDFRVLDDNVPQDIRYFSKQSDLPLRIGMLLDTSNSIRDRLKFEQDAANNFLFSVLRRNKDEAFVMTFDDEPEILQGFTGDTGALRDKILRTRAGGGTAVYDAIYDACFKELSHPPRPPGDQPDVVRRVMILISDGEDNLSTRTRAEAIEMAQRTSVVIYTISTSTQWVTLDDPSKEKTGNRKYHLTEGDKVLQDLADETGALVLSVSRRRSGPVVPRHRRGTAESVFAGLQSEQPPVGWAVSQDQDRDTRREGLSGAGAPGVLRTGQPGYRDDEAERHLKVVGSSACLYRPCEP